MRACGREDVAGGGTFSRVTAGGGVLLLGTGAGVGGGVNDTAGRAGGAVYPGVREEDAARGGAGVGRLAALRQRRACGGVMNSPRYGGGRSPVAGWYGWRSTGG